MVAPIEKNTPCARPVTMRAISKVAKLVACQAKRLPSTKTAININNTFLRGQRAVAAVSSGALSATDKA